MNTKTTYKIKLIHEDGYTYTLKSDDESEIHYSTNHEYEFEDVDTARKLVHKIQEDLLYPIFIRSSYSKNTAIGEEREYFFTPKLINKSLMYIDKITKSYR